jgi:hypothetical protein
MEGHRGAVLACQIASVEEPDIIRRNGGAMTIETGTKKGTDSVSEDQPVDRLESVRRACKKPPTTLLHRGCLREDPTTTFGGDTESRSALPTARSAEHLTCARILQMQQESQLGVSTRLPGQPFEMPWIFTSR